MRMLYEMVKKKQLYDNMFGVSPQIREQIKTETVFYNSGYLNFLLHIKPF